MAGTADITRLDARPRTPEGSRATRRLRRSGRVPGVVYGGEGEPLPFDVDARELRHALNARGAVLELALDAEAVPVVVKDTQIDPVRGETLHVDLLRVRLDQPVQATAVLVLEGADDAPGVREGGVLEQVTRELNVEALPRDLPDQITFDVSSLEMNATVTLDAVTPPSGVTLLDDPETVVATVTPPRVEVAADEEIEQETELVGEEGGVTADEAADEAVDADTTSE